MHCHTGWEVAHASVWLECHGLLYIRSDWGRPDQLLLVEQEEWRSHAKLRRGRLDPRNRWHMERDMNLPEAIFQS